MSMSSPSSVSDRGSGIDKLFRVVTCSLPLSFFKKASLYLIGNLGCSCQSLAVDTVEVMLSVDSEEDSVHSVLLGDTGVESVELSVDGELNDEQHDEGDEEPGDRLSVFDGWD